MELTAGRDALPESGFIYDLSFFRLLDVDDEPNANEYPLQVFKHRGKRLRCRVCDVYTAR